MLLGIQNIYLNHFRKHGESSIPFLVNGKLSSFILLSAYKKLKPIEEMAEEEKVEMKSYAIELFPNKSVEELMAAVKIIYTIGVLL